MSQHAVLGWWTDLTVLGVNTSRMTRCREHATAFFPPLTTPAFSRSAKDHQKVRYVRPTLSG